MAVQRAVSLNLQGGNWVPVLGLGQPCEEELLCGVVCPPRDSSMRQACNTLAVRVKGYLTVIRRSCKHLYVQR